MKTKIIIFVFLVSAFQINLSSSSSLSSSSQYESSSQYPSSSSQYESSSQYPSSSSQYESSSQYPSSSSQYESSSPYISETSPQIESPTPSPPECYATCSANFVLDYNTCSCVCNNRCQFPKILDTNSCGCICPSFMTCPSGYFYNFKTYRDCSCDKIIDVPSTSCNLKCYGNYTVDYTDCKCKCNLKCPPNCRFDSDRCECILPSCPPNFIQDPITHECKCDQSYHLDCNYNQKWDNQTCRCACAQSEVCKPGFYFDRNICGCICEPKQCETSFKLNSKTCSCECDLSSADASCPNGHVFSYVTCQCELKPSLAFPSTC